MKNDYIAFDNGFYPNDWQEDSLGKLCDYVDYRGATPAKKARGIFLITAKNIKKGYIDYSISQEYVAANDYGSTMHRGLPKLGDVLITTEAPVGNVAQVDKEKVALAQRIIKYCAHECVVNNTFLKYMLLSYNFQKKLESASTGGTVQGIKGSLLHNLKIAYPKIEEQTAIATALSDTDALIDSLEKLIAKKQAIKQGAMQELLTGKRRLKGFSGEWKKIILGSPLYTKIDYDNLSFHTPLDYEFDYITLENVKNGVLEKLIHCSYESSPSRARRIVHKNDILFGTVRPNLRSHLYIYDEVQDLICSTGFCVIHTHEEILSSAFVFYKMFSDEIDVQVQAIIAGSNYPAISNSDVHNLEISIPSDIQEQQAIAQILTDMDDEISALQKKLDKVRRIKQGMMAELLTGRIRLI